MGYMIKSDILNALKEDKEASLYLFRKNKKRRNVEEIIEFCYDSMGYVLDRLQQYRTDNVYEDAKDTNALSKWIPCSERLPENAMNVIAQFSSGTVTELRYAGNGIFEGIYEYSTKVIIAWMPLPEPYKQNDEGAEK